MMLTVGKVLVLMLHTTKHVACRLCSRYEDNKMRNAFFGCVVCVFGVLCASARAGEEQSVLVPTPAVVAAPATAIVTTDCPCGDACACANSAVVYTRPGLFANRPARRAAREIARATGGVVRSVGVVTYNVVTWPVRGCRSGSCR